MAVSSQLKQFVRMSVEREYFLQSFFYLRFEKIDGFEDRKSRQKSGMKLNGTSIPLFGECYLHVFVSSLPIDRQFTLNRSRLLPYWRRKALK